MPIINSFICLKNDYQRNLWKEMSQKLFNLFQKAATEAFNVGLLNEVQKEEFFMSGRVKFT